LLQPFNGDNLLRREYEKNIRENDVKANLESIILRKLTKYELHGYEFIKEIREEFGVYLGPSTIYPTLKELEKMGLVASRWDHSSERPRKVYRITIKGLKYLRLERDVKNRNRKKMNELSAKQFCIQPLQPVEVEIQK